VRSEYNDENATGRWATFENARDDLRYIGTGMFVVGTALVGTAVYLYVTAPKAYRERAEQAAITPIVGPDQLGFAYGRAF